MSKARDLKAGDVVLVMTDLTPRGTWPLGRVTEIYPDKDGHVRKASVKVGSSTYIRPISKMCLLMEEDIQN